MAARPKFRLTPSFSTTAASPAPATTPSPAGSGLAREHLVYDGHVRTNVRGATGIPEIDSAVRRGVNANELVGPNLIRKEFSERYMWERIAEPMFSRYAPKMLEMLRWHQKGIVYVHKMPEAVFFPYCAGHDYSKVLRKGLRKAGSHRSAPAKHFWTAVRHASNFLMLSQQYWTGAQAFGSLETWLAPFVRRDGLSYEQIKREIESMYYELNMPYRPGQESPFTNNTVLLWTSELQMKRKPVVGGRAVSGEALGDYVEEAALILRAIFETELGGDADGRPFTFPIQNVMFSEKMDKELQERPELFEAFWKAAGVMGAQYFENAIEGTRNALGKPAWLPSDMTIAMCCRYIIRKDKLQEASRARGVFSINDETGSKGIITVNLPRLALESGQDLQRMLELLEERMREVGKALVEWHSYYMKLRWELLPDVFAFMNEYQRPMEFERQYFMTFGAIGMPEMALILADESTEAYTSWDYGAQFRLTRDYILPVIEKMVEVADSLTGETGVPFNVEEVPAETAGSKLLRKDLAEFGEEVLGKYVNLESTMYSNTVYPYWGRATILQKAEIEWTVQWRFTGGVMHHFWIGTKIDDPEASRKLVLKILGKGVINMSLSPLICVGGECWTRIVGWYRPIDGWNDYRKKEFRTRTFHSLGEMRRYEWTPNGVRLIEKENEDPFAGLL